MAGKTACVVLKRPSRFTPRTSSHIALVILTNDLSRVIPALFTRMLIGPNSVNAALTMVWISSELAALAR